MKILDEFRRKLDNIMVKAIKRRIVLWGYGRSGQFIQWYAEYYHSLTMDFIVRENMDTDIPYSMPIYAPSVFDFRYKDINNAVVWLTFHDSGRAKEKLERLGYKKNIDYFDLCEAIYGNDLVWENDESADIFRQRKTGYRDIQFLEYIEYKLGCNFVTLVEESLYATDRLITGYRVTAMREIFAILDKCHCVPQKDAIFDFGCGKGAAILSFLEYGFENVGGGELDESMYSVLQHNFALLQDQIEGNVELLCGDILQLTTELDRYNWFYCFLGGEGVRWAAGIVKRIAESVERSPRKVTVIVRNPDVEDLFENAGFILTNQFTIDTRQKVVNIYVMDGLEREAERSGHE